MKRGSRLLDEIYGDLGMAYAEWQNRYTNGGTDPFWPDGCNLELCRNHILYYKREIDESYPDAPKRALYLRELPPEVEQTYMANADGIRKSARQTLQAMKENADYIFLLEHLPKIEPRLADKMCIGNVLAQVSVLETAIEKDDLVTQRRYRDAGFRLDSFKGKTQEVRSMKPPEQEQLSMFYQSSFEEETEETEGEEQGWGLQL